ncbi:MAG: ATP-binding protein [Alphaproteobacteria bacterium]|nr:ATP-binding protein [Alphaproteobacteria bacterium]MBT5390054.1 ATP-binding protein [Alphaproteobacteria bacterium]MBT5540576.1 ATP-binding protein [Alphaproteobacteria bacterium]
MIKRHLFDNLKGALQRQPAVVLVGPRQVGKTTLALEVCKGLSSIYVDLESFEDLQKLDDPLLFLNANKDNLVILDEIQRTPELFMTLRGIIDAGRREGKKYGHFLLLGSASLDLIKQSSESLAGRISQLELTPFTALEISGTNDQLWLRGGFPESFLARNDSESYKWRLDFISTYLERDIPQLGPRIPAETLRRLWTMLAHVQGTTLNVSTIGTSLGISGQTVTRYIDLLVDLLLLKRLQPYHGNMKKRLVRSPKIYIRDSGLVHALLGISSMNELLGHPISGASWEGYVIENIINCAPESTTPYFYKTSAGAEIDLILVLPNGDVWTIEVKKSTSPKVTKGFYFANEDIKPTQKFVIYSGKEQYPIQEGIEVISLELFLKKLSSLEQ